MLVKPHELIDDALEKGYAIGAFNTYNLEVSQAVVAAAAAQSSPVIVQTSEGAIKYAGLEVLAAIITKLGEEAAVPVVLHLDHGKSLEVVQQCIAAGYTSVMIDASVKQAAENIAITKQVVSYAHDRGVWVEAELGTILGAEGAIRLDGEVTPDNILTDPDDVKQFVDETGVDALAVSVGTIHGAFTGQEYIRFELLDKIEEIVPALPLVVHGASGIADEHLARVSRSNVCKINVDTEMRIAFEGAVRSYLNEAHDVIDPRKMLGPARASAQEVVEAKMNTVGSSGKFKV